MSNVIPPLLSSSPPPMVGVLDEEEDDEFGDFAVATNLSYGCDALSLPSSPQKSPKKSMNQSVPNHCHDVDTNNSEITDINSTKTVAKDFQDKRKISATNSSGSERIASASESSASGLENHTEVNVNNLLYNNGKIKPKTDSKYSTFQYFPEIPPDIAPENEDDEFEDVGNGYVEEFEDFQEFESSANFSSSVTDSKCIPDETDIPDINCAEDPNSEPSLKLAEQALNDCKSNEENEDLKENNGKCDQAPEINDESLQIEGNISETMNSQMTDYPVTAVNQITSNCKENSVITKSSLANATNSELQESICKENFVADLSSTQMFNRSTISNQDDCFRDKNDSESKNVEIHDDQCIIQEPPSDKISVDDDDDFGDFENHSFKPDVGVSQPMTQHQVVDLVPEYVAVQEKDKLDLCDDDFGDFETPLSELKLEWDSDPFNNSRSVVNDANNFGDFDNQTFEEPPQPNEGQDYFGAFGDFSTVGVTQIDQTSKLEEVGDDFGDFNDYSAQAQTSHSSSGEDVENKCGLKRVISVDVETIPQQAQTIILEMFPIIKQLAEDYYEEDFTTDNAIFVQLKDVTDTCALLYQWSKSNSQHCLLKALNIDTRNILYGPRWNESMPRYAATLGFTPLEPVKSEALTPTTSEPSTTVVLPSSQTPSSESAPQTDIPSAQFDWVGSGLTNPLEMTPKKIVEKRDSQLKETRISEQISLHTEVLTKSHQEIVPKSDFEFASVLQPEVSTVLQAHSDSGSVKSLQLNEIQPEEVINKVESTSESDGFTSFQSSSKSEESPGFSNWSFNAIPLRETHISNLQSGTFVTKPEKTGPSFEEPGWLKPTIVTPDLPRKVNVVEDPPEEEDEFADFQTSEPSVKSVPVKSENIEHEAKSDLCVNKHLVVDKEDDEFTDFQSTLPNSNQAVKPTPAPPEPLQPAILEPLKPSVLLQPMASTSINWPDPGITDDDLIRIELNYKPKSSNSDSETPLEIDLKEKSGRSTANQEPSKNTEDDDWSDFVSNQGASAPLAVHEAQPVFKTTSQVKQPSRTSTPELSLSVPQLNQVQAPRRPVPVITQQGLIQTKLPIEPVVQPSVQQTKTYPQVSLQNGFQPSLISNQFAAQCGQALGYRSFHQNKPPQTIDVHKQSRAQNLQQDFYGSLKSSQYYPPSQTSKPPPVSSSNPEEFDDEWTDFVSSQPAPAMVPPTVPNGVHGNPQPKLNFDWNRPPQFTSWSTNVTPNIITNPVSFDSFKSYTPPAQTDLLKSRTSNRKNPNAVVQPKKSTIPSISSVPDLEFIAPKSRTWKK